MSVVFVSYAHVDEGRVRALVEQLKGSQIAVWWDKDIPPGADWEDLLDTKIQEAAKILIVCSNESIHRDEVRHEARYAIKTKKALPVRIEDVELPFRWTGFQYVDLMRTPIDANPQWTRLLEVARGNGAVQMTPDQADEFALNTSGARRDTSVAMPWEAIVPAMFVMLSLMTSVLGPPSPWTTVAAIALGTLAFLSAIWVVIPRRSS